MSSDSVLLTVPALPQYARLVRMTAASLAACFDMSVDAVEDIRIMAEEGFVYACSGSAEHIDISMSQHEDSFEMNFSLGDTQVNTSELELTILLLSALCREFSTDYNTHTLHLVSQTGYADVE